MSIRFLHSLLRLVSATALVIPLPAASQEATVTFYSHGTPLKTGFPGSKSGVFFGAIYDSADRLFIFRDGLSRVNNRYATFHLAAGTHVFSGSYNNKASQDNPLTLDLKPGKHYFVRAQSESTGIVIVEVEHGRLDQVTCETAGAELAKAKPLPQKAISPDAVDKWLPQELISPCPSADSPVAGETSK